MAKITLIMLKNILNKIASHINSRNSPFGSSFTLKYIKLLHLKKYVLLTKHNIIGSGVASPAFLLEGITYAHSTSVTKPARTRDYQTRL